LDADKHGKHEKKDHWSGGFYDYIRWHFNRRRRHPRFERRPARHWQIGARLLEFQTAQTGKTMRLAQQLETLTGLESRVTILGYVQRGGTPSAMDRLLATELGTATTALINEGAKGVMVAIKNRCTEPVPLEEVVDKLRTVPLDHLWIDTARRVGTCLGD
jgi:6-phosphofructokinase